MSPKPNTLIAPFPTDFEPLVRKELNEGREFNAIFLVHNYIAVYLREWLFLSGKISKDDLKAKIIENIDRIQPSTIITIHVILGNIDEKLYSKLSSFNKSRNKLAHDLLKTDLQDSATKKKLHGTASFGIEICKQVFDLYKKDLDKKYKKLESA